MPKTPLPDQRPDRMLDQVLPAMIAKAIRKATHQIDRPIRRTQKQRSGIRCHQPAIKGRFHSPTFPHLPNQTVLRYTLSASGRSLDQRKVVCCTTTFADSRPRCASTL